MNLVKRVEKLEERSPPQIEECHLIPSKAGETSEDAIKRYCQENNIEPKLADSPDVRFIILTPLTRCRGDAR